MYDRESTQREGRAGWGPKILQNPIFHPKPQKAKLFIFRIEICERIELSYSLILKNL